MDKISYALGLSIGNNFLSSGIKKIDIKVFAKALEDVLNDNQPAMSYDEAKSVINDYFTNLQAEKLDINEKAGQEFLEINKKRPSVVTLPSGLQYEIITKGEGKLPQATDQVKCHYHGTLIDGTVFDSSVQRGTPATFGVNQVIKGWVEALQLMPVGSKWKLFIPADLAYGKAGAGQSIEPNSALVFEVEVLDIV
ncbi:FKBP-type peptidyl-prolyl cis-trans isomerase FklB [Dysgonomonas alginatilytica]|uniref:Peptidyl-prolyl cis-trans isomerase n=1 Tax=Dysgonomonas alginatilytica TaxID=1605892 RepID=A0A2V3PTP3_9BACT|nr:FKBP-type peptidyl-prolyl cis-trans isomerase [Dysgonomonas alginatilytica]PXV67538.1 FKBP-type peptidyl-prolyl cis-trans isomerase FklB [Dysgonomonas alginatilytica]